VRTGRGAAGLPLAVALYAEGPEAKGLDSGRPARGG
jgi:hypothetical protein